jgi:hypothetical protein
MLRRIVWYTCTTILEKPAVSIIHRVAAGSRFLRNIGTYLPIYRCTPWWTSRMQSYYFVRVFVLGGGGGKLSRQQPINTGSFYATQNPPWAWDQSCVHTGQQMQHKTAKYHCNNRNLNPWSQCTYYLQTLPNIGSLNICSFSPTQFFKSKKENEIIFLKCAQSFFLAQWDEDGGRILMGDNTGGETVMRRPIRFQCVRVWMSAGFPCSILDHKYTQFRLALNSTRAWPSETKTTA